MRKLKIRGEIEQMIIVVTICLEEFLMQFRAKLNIYYV